MSEQKLQKDDRRIGIITASWHGDLIEIAYSACVARLVREGLAAERIDRIVVPGSLEIPLMSQGLAKTGRFECLIAIGLIVNGGIYRHEFVAQAVLDGIMRVQLESSIPVMSAVLTPINFHEHKAHHDFFAEHLKTKGEEVADSLVALLKERKRVLG
jgi:6,7-dimethyl-8-ribityllumazine synthase